MSITIRPLTPNIGAKISGVDLTTQPAPKIVAQIYQAWLDHVVILFRGQDLSQQDQLRVSGWFGPVGRMARPEEYRTKGHRDLLPDIMLISNVRENGEPIGALPDGDMMYHHDMLHNANPHKATVLYSVDVPSEGGNTLFANLYKAYETLPDEVRDPLEGHDAFHHYHFGTTHRDGEEGIEAFAESEHPVFLTHNETGRRAVYVNRLMTRSIVGMDKGQSNQLLDRLFDHSENPEFVYAHQWQKGDLLVWDNRCSMHARTDFLTAERRLLWRTTVQDAPPAIAGAAE